MEKRIICNCCGKEIGKSEGICEDKGMIKADYLHIEKEWGYFSNKDGRIHEFDLCEECYDEIVSHFQIPPRNTEVTELV